jgi:hypothetical protein
MKVHGALNAWNYFYKPQLVAWLQALPAKTKTILVDVSFQIRLAVLLALLGLITKQLAQLTNGKA